MTGAAEHAAPHSLDALGAAARAEAFARGRLAARIEALIALIDERLSAQVDAIVHQPRFQTLEAAWRGVDMLLRTAEGGGAGAVRLKLLDVSWAALSRSFERAAEFDQSRLFELVYSQEFGQAGGEPFGLLVGAYEITWRIDRRAGGDPVSTMGAVASVAAAAFCPFVAGAHPSLLDMETFRELADLSDLAAVLSSHGGDPARAAGLARWERLRGREDARFLGLAAPRILLREPRRGPDRRRRDGFRYAERIGASGEGLLWGSAAFAFAAVAIRQFDETGWFADIRGAPQDDDGGGLVPALAPLDFGTDGGGMSAQAPVEARLTGLQRDQLAGAGLVPVGTLYGDPRLVFDANPSLHRPPRYERAEASENARLAAMLQYVMCASRFAHYLKVIMRDEVGSSAPAAALETRLQTWLAGYCVGNEDASNALRARHPLRSAGVQVRDMAGRPGAYACTIHLQPHFQLDDVSTAFQLVAETAEAA